MISQSGSASAVNSTTRLRYLVELGVVGFERQLLGHEVDGNGFDALELGQLVLKLARTVGAVDFVEFELLFSWWVPFPVFAAWGRPRWYRGWLLFADMAHALVEHGVDVVVGERV